MPVSSFAVGLDEALAAFFQVVAAIYGVASDTGSIVSVCCTGVTKACAA